jgi:flagellar basal-body rod modification protein FlgD
MATVNTAGTATASTAVALTDTAMGSLAGNFQAFLQLLMTQLQNQDPTSPLDANQFTSQLVEFASVEQQINTNRSLGDLISLTQSGQVLQSAGMVGRTVEVESERLSLQNGSAALRFTAATDGPVAVAILSEAGVKLADATVQAQKGDNEWRWNGVAGTGAQLRDGTYRVAVTAANASGTSSALPFTVLATATGVQRNGDALKLELGGQSVDFAAVRAVLP